LSKENDNKISSFQTVEEKDIFSYCKDLMMVYGINVNISRITPHIVDGLKPVFRRILYSMYMDKNLPKNSRDKVSAIVGNTMSRLHPHGDIAIRDALVAGAQWWTNNLLYIDPKGNFGSIDGDQCAASRYIEARMSEYAYDCFFSEWNEKITDFTKSYNAKVMEPAYLPCKYPNILFNGIFGLGWGLSTNIPPFNMNEAIDLTIKLIKDPKLKDVYLIPDSPTGCDIIDEGKFKDMCEKGSKESYKMRANIDITKDGNLWVHSLPYAVAGNKVVEKMIELVKSKKLDGIANIIHKTKNNIDILIEIKKGYDPNLIKEELYRSTDLENTYYVNFEVVYDFQVQSYNLKRLILDWIELRRETKHRVYSYDYSKLSKRIHILEALIQIVPTSKFDDKIIPLMRRSNNRGEIIEALINNFGLTDLQAENISDMKLYQLSIENISGWRKELEELSIKAKELENILGSTDVIDEIIINELTEGKRKFGYKRRSAIIKVDNEEYIPDINYTIIFTKKGYFKKLEQGTFNNIGIMNKDDFLISSVNINNRETLLLFDDKGKAFTLPVKDLPVTDIRSGGFDLKRYCDCSNVIAVMKKYNEEELMYHKEPLYLIFITEDGTIKKSLYKNFNSNFKGLIAIKLKKDKLIEVKMIKGDKDIIIYTKDGFGIRYNTSEIPESLRMSMGVTGIKLDENDQVLGMNIVDKDSKYLLIVTDKGNGKKCLMYNLDAGKRAGKNYKLITLNDDEKLFYVKTLDDEHQQIEYQTNTNKENVQVNDIPELTRIARGKKIIPVRKGEYLIGLIG
jgi:DNA gyrase subunit A